MTREELERELEVHKENEDIFLNCMRGITLTLGLSEHTLWEEVEDYARYLKEFYELSNELEDARNKIKKFEDVKNKIKELKEENKNYFINEDIKF